MKSGCMVTCNILFEQKNFCLDSKILFNVFASKSHWKPNAMDYRGEINYILGLIISLQRFIKKVFCKSLLCVTFATLGNPSFVCVDSVAVKVLLSFHLSLLNTFFHLSLSLSLSLLCFCYDCNHYGKCCQQNYDLKVNLLFKNKNKITNFVFSCSISH